MKKKKRVLKKYFLPLSKRWDFLVIFLFLLARLILNLKWTSLTIFFVISYVLLLVLMFTFKRAFFVGTIVFLFIDSLIGTFLYTIWNEFGLEYFGTMAFNLIIILFLIFDMNGNFLKK